MYIQVESTKERIDLEQLKVKEKIFFYEDIILYEDELADNGIAKLNVKMVIITSYYVLQCAVIWPSWTCIFVLIYHRILVLLESLKVSAKIPWAILVFSEKSQIIFEAV